MMGFIRILLVGILAAVYLALPVAAANAASNNDQVFSACSQAPNSPVCKDKNTTENPVVHIINVAADIIAILTGLAAVIMIIISGLAMITSGGNQEAVANARRRLIGALIGLAIVVLAWTITRFIIDKLVQ